MMISSKGRYALRVMLDMAEQGGDSFLPLKDIADRQNISRKYLESIMPDLAKEAGAAVVGTGRSDFPNQINNVLAFPGIFRGAFDVRASDINDEMKVAAAYAIAGLVSEEELNADYILPAAFDPRVKDAVAAAVAEAARKSGVARI